MIPLFVDFADETVLVFGGGSVGARKARLFADEARVVLVSPTFTETPAAVDCVRAAPNDRSVGAWIDRADPALVVAATDDAALNAAIADAAVDRGVLYNRADRRGGDRPAASVTVPATSTDGPVTVAVGTDGRAPALSKSLREEIDPLIDDAGAMARLIDQLREEWADWPADERRSALRQVVRSDRVWTALGAEGDNAQRRAVDVIESGGDPP
ncbi:precorrin-2 dehydrogenase/sirohydrochlorin ferrochelatase family protein [Halococcoides cellulosivorans]|uniref:precorrin-2 dehydrogenase n=1 Tax=Halococcoides cellulosivorans TaxID=1679096 RepID=A0A2R4X0G2_9EURY|nr:bifunctional precorrin-2 dehydrogenase/sirohydrochlorin ferrochelatase [Halococcoides cellulosivorans]AWB27292.1 siroheme synthase [Halococcoides cellulosivorans]